MTDNAIGIGLSRSDPDVFHPEALATERFENSPRGFRSHGRWLSAPATVRVVSGGQTGPRQARVARQAPEPDDGIARHIAGDRPTSRKRERLCSIPGPGKAAADATLAFLPEIRTLDRRQAAILPALVKADRLRVDNPACA